jgi:hypothetical protein
MMPVNRAMLAGALGLIAAGAPAAIYGGVAVNLLQQGISTIRNAAFDDTQRAAFADGGAGLPIGMNLERADPAKAGGGEFADGFQKEAGDSGCGC